MKTVIAACATLIGMASAAAAADLPARTAPAPILANAPYSWFGFYAGAHGGYTWSDADTRLVGVNPGGLFEAEVAARTLAAEVRMPRNGAMAGGQIGYNLQFGMYVVGIEADASWVDAKAKKTYSGLDVIAFPGVMTHSTFRSELDAFGTLRARAGFALDRALIYATGGLAVGSVKNSFQVTIPGYYENSWSRRDTEWGWAAGAGVEYAFTNSLSVKLEYLHYDLGNRTIRYVDPPVFGTEHLDYRTINSGEIVRAGVNVRF